jgi:alpha-L-fucosidase
MESINKDSIKFIEEGIGKFRTAYSLDWDQLVAVTCGDVLESLTGRKVLYSKFKPDYAVFEPSSAAEADEIAASLAAKGVDVRADQRFGEKVFLYVFSPAIPLPVGPYPEIPLPENWVPPFGEHKLLPGTALPGEITPFYFNGELHRLGNFTRYDGGRMIRGCEIRRESDDAVLSTPFTGHYFSIAFMWENKCWCFGRNDENGMKIDLTVSEDLIHWSEPETVWDISETGIRIFNCSVAFDGKRFVMAYENNNPAFPIFTLNFLESTDLRHWQTIPGAVYGENKYIGGPSLYYMPDGFYYVTYVDQFVHPQARKLNYRTSIARSKDLVNWEDAPDGRAVVAPVYDHQPEPVPHPEVFEFNASDAEYIEIGDKVRVYFLGGNQQGVWDNQYAECKGSRQEGFQSFCK